MRWVTTHNHALHIHEKSVENSGFSGFEQAIRSRAVHELLFDVSMPAPLFPALLAASAVMHERLAMRQSAMVVWIDPDALFYPPAAIAAGIAPRHLCILRPRECDLVWTTVECLRCPSIAAVVAPIMRPLSRVEARKIQLAAEQGGGAGILLRPNQPGIYAAATRWKISPVPGERTIHRWRIELLHGHGRQNIFLLERHRDSGKTHFVHPSAAVVHHPAVQAAS